MATYYIDSNATYAANHANNGTDSSTPWGGVGGIQRALGVVAAGETIYAKAGTTLDVSKLVKVVATGTKVGTLAVDNLVYCFEFATGSPTTAEAGGGQGYIVLESPAKTYYIQVTAGTWTTGAAHCISKENAATFSNYIEAITASYLGFVYPVVGTSSAARVKLVGVNASWTEDGTRTVLDSATVATNENALAAWHEWRNIRVTRSSSHGVTGIQTSRFINCSVDASYYSGFNGPGVFYCCNGSSNVGTATSNGFNASNASHLFGCKATHNAGNGIAGLSYDTSVVDCLVHGNSFSGITVVGYGLLITGCVIDGNTQNGILSSGDGVIVGNRITNNSTGSASYYGINGNAGQNTMEDYNVFYNNGNQAPGTNQRNAVSVGAHSLTATNTTEQGYTDPATHDFNLTTAAIGRNVAVALD